MRQSKLFTAAIIFTFLAAMVVGCVAPSATPTPTPSPTPAPTPTPTPTPAPTPTPSPTPTPGPEDNMAQTHLEQGNVYADQEQWDEAIVEYGKAIELKPRFAEAYLLRGLACIEICEVAKAVSDLERCTELSADPALVERAHEAQKLIFYDDFSNPGSGWGTAFEEDLYECGYEDGEYFMWMGEYRWMLWNVNENAGRFSDFALEIDGRITSGPKRSHYGVVFRAQDLDNFYLFLVTGLDGYYYVGKWVEGDLVAMGAHAQSVWVEEGYDTNHLKVVCEGSQIELYANGHHLTTIVRDDSFAEGYVGMIVEAPIGTTRVAFDNITVCP